MQHGLGQRDEGNEQPGHLPVRHATLLLAALAALGVLLSGCGAAARLDGPDPVVLISGRDDHGLVARAAVGLQRSPTDTTVVGSAPDGTFARVVRTEGAWLDVRTVASAPEEGWVNDFYLRSRAVWVSRSLQVTFLDAAFRENNVLVYVSPITDPPEQPSWLAAGELREVGAR